MEGDPQPAIIDQEAESQPDTDFGELAKYFIVRMIVALLVVFGSFAFKNINILLAIGGSLVGTLMTIVMPVVFY